MLGGCGARRLLRSVRRTFPTPPNPRTWCLECGTPPLFPPLWSVSVERKTVKGSAARRRHSTAGSDAQSISTVPSPGSRVRPNHRMLWGRGWEGKGKGKADCEMGQPHWRSDAAKRLCNLCHCPFTQKHPFPAKFWPHSGATDVNARNRGCFTTCKSNPRGKRRRTTTRAAHRRVRRHAQCCACVGGGFRPVPRRLHHNSDSYFTHCSCRCRKYVCASANPLSNTEAGDAEMSPPSACPSLPSPPLTCRGLPG